jgi:all-trans-retinol 13,14-reductase
MNIYDVVVVGSGISSLTAANLLAKKGLSVCVLEQYKKPGGYLHSFKRFNHFYETGAHYSGALDEGQPFHTLLKYLGIYDPELFIPLDPEGFDVFNFPHFEYAFPKGYASVVQSLTELFPNEKESISRFFGMIETTVRDFQTYHYSLEANLESLIEGLETSLKKVVCSLFREPRLQSLLYGHCYLHGVFPEDISFSLHALVMDSIIRGPYGFKLGGDVLANRFKTRLESFGGVLKLGAKVVKLHTEDRLITEVELASGERIRGKTVVSGVHPKETFRWLDSDCLPPLFHRRIQKIQESEAIFGIYAEMSSEVPLSRTRNYYYFNSDDPVELLKVNSPEGIPRLVFVCCPDREGKQISSSWPLTFHAPGPFSWFSQWKQSQTGRRAPEYRGFKGELAEKVLDFVDGRVPGLRKAVGRYETSTALTNLYFNGSEEGSGYGIYHSMENTGLRAIGPRTRIKNLLLTGQNTLIPGLLGAATSGLRTAGELVGLGSFISDLIKVRDS